MDSENASMCLDTIKLDKSFQNKLAGIISSEGAEQKNLDQINIDVSQESLRKMPKSKGSSGMKS